MCLVVIGIAAVVSGQDQIPGRSTLERLLVEVKGLRSEVTHATGASIRAQLLVARLQLQEQRITNIGRQIADVENELSAMEQNEASASTRLKQLEETRDRLTVEQREQVDREAETLAASIEQERRRARDLRAQGKELETVLVDEQSRWSDFNGRLDDLELSLPTR